MSQGNWLVIGVLLMMNLVLADTSAGQQKYIILADRSGSLKENDPLDLRKDSLRFLLDQLSSDDSVALYSFGEGADAFGKGNVLFLSVGKERSWLAATIDTFKREDGITDLRTALRKIIVDLEREGSGSPATLLIFTDAQLQERDIPSGIRLTDYLEDIYQLGSDLALRQVRVVGLAFTRAADLSYLQRLASITNGYALPAATPEAANQIIVRLLSSITGGPYRVNTDIPIQVTTAIQSFKVFAFNRRADTKLPIISLFDPQGRPATDVETREYAASVSVQKTDPAPGQWGARVAGASEVEVFYTKRPRYELVFHAPAAKEMSACQNSQIAFDLEVTQAGEEILKDFSAMLRILGQGGDVLLQQDLIRSGNRFKGMLTPRLGQGTYTVDASVAVAAQETLTRSFILEVRRCPEITLMAKADPLIGRPVSVTVTKPDDLKAEDLRARLIFPDPTKQPREFSLHDDGSPDNGDALAGDNVLSAVVRDFEDPGAYTLEVVARYQLGGAPVSDKKSTKILKIVELEPDPVKMIFPRNLPWQEEGTLTLTNRSAYEVTITGIAFANPETSWIGMEIVRGPVTIGPREKQAVKVRFEGKIDPGETAEVAALLHFSARDLQLNSMVEPAGRMPVTYAFFKAAPLSLIVVRIATGTVLFILLSIGVGLFIVTPMRLKDWKFYDKYGESPLSGHPRNLLQSSILLPSGRVIGIAYFGYGRWYLRDGKEMKWGAEEIGLYR